MPMPAGMAMRVVTRMTEFTDRRTVFLSRLTQASLSTGMAESPSVMVKVGIMFLISSTVSYAPKR